MHFIYFRVFGFLVFFFFDGVDSPSPSQWRPSLLLADFVWQAHRTSGAALKVVELGAGVAVCLPQISAVPQNTPGDNCVFFENFET